MNEEMCIICDQETEKAGIGDDSIYRILKIDLPNFNKLKIGDDIGPLCDLCNDCLETIGILIEEEIDMTYKPPATTKAEMVEAVEESCRIAALPNKGELDTSINYQLGVLKYLAKHLPDEPKNSEQPDG